MTRARSFASRRAPRVAAVLFAGLLAAGCEPVERGNGWGGTVDTLPGGAVRVHSPAEGAWDSASAWQVEETLRIGSVQGGGPDVFGNVGDVALDGSGRVYALDRDRQVVEVFDRRGDHVRTLGGEGRGPGELSRAFGLAFGPEGRLWVADAGNSRYTVYDTAGRYEISFRRRLSGHVVPWPGTVTESGMLYDVDLEVREGDYRRILVGYRIRDRALERADTTWIPASPIPTDRRQVTVQRETGIMAFGIPYAPGLQWWLDRGGDLWFGRTDRYRIVRRTLAGDTLGIVEREYDPVPVGAEDPRVEQHLETLEERNVPRGESRIPEEKPAFRSIRTDDRGYLWVQVYSRSDGEGTPVDVFEPEGRYLGRLRLPFSTGRRTAFRGDTMCGTATGELDVERVVCVRVRR